jgi:RecB family exonuclease
VPLNLIHGPPNSGRAGLVRRRFTAAAERDPVLVLPTLDDVYAFERELCEDGAQLGGEAMTFGALFRVAAAAADGSAPPAELTPAQRLRAISLAVESRLPRLGPLRRSASRPGFPRSFARLLDELQGAGIAPEAVEASAATLEGSAYLGDLAALYGGYAEARDELGRTDAHGIARQAIELLRRDPGAWGGRPVFLYGLDDLTPNQLDLVEALDAAAEVTVALPYEPGNAALAARERLLETLRERIGFAEQTATAPDPANTDSRLLFHLARGFGAEAPEPQQPDGSLVLLRAAGVRGEAEMVAERVARLLHDGAEPDEIAIALRDPAHRGAAIAAALEANGIATALEAELPVAGSGAGGALLALLEAEFGDGSAAQLLRYMRAGSGLPRGWVDWFERDLRRGRVADAAPALERWAGLGREPLRDLEALREAASRSPAALATAAARLVATMAARPLRGEDGPLPGRGDGFELRAAAAIGSALTELAELGRRAPAPPELAATVATLTFRGWSGPVEGRVRIADPYRLRAARFDHVFVPSLQDGEFPRRDRGGDPFLSEAQRQTLGLEPRRDTEAEERYLFQACLSLPRKRLFLSYRDSDEDGGAESRSPLLDEVRALLAPAADGTDPDPVEAAITVSRDLAEVVWPLAEAPSEDELARSLAAHGAEAETAPLLAAAGLDAPLAERLAARAATARRAEAAARAPGPLTNPAVLASLGSVPAYGGTTLEQFDVCSYRWFAGHELDPQPLDPLPDGLVQGGLMHAALDRLYKERPGGDPLPRPASLAAWTERGRELLAALTAERELGAHPSERAIARRVERLLERFLAEEAERKSGGFEPWLLEAGFGEQEDSERPVLELDGWGLHGAIDRVDRDREGRAVVIDYKLSGRVTPLEKFEEQAKLQLPLYLLAVERHWGAAAVGALYHPLRATSTRRPRGIVLDEAAADLAAYGLYPRDVVDAAAMEEVLAESRRRAGEIVARMRGGEIRRDPGPRRGLRGHDTCPTFCTFAPICRRDRALQSEEDEGVEDR